MIDMCYLQEVGWRGQGTRIPEMKGRRYKQWWSGKGDGVGGVGDMVKVLCEKVLEVRRISERVMTAVALEEDVLRLICGYASKSRICLEENQSFYELKYEWKMHSAGDLTISFGDFNGHAGMILMDLMGFM